MHANTPLNPYPYFPTVAYGFKTAQYGEHEYDMTLVSLKDRKIRIKDIGGVAKATMMINSNANLLMTSLLNVICTTDKESILHKVYVNTTERPVIGPKVKFMSLP